jgi:hypothetical protein
MGAEDVCHEILVERARQDAKWGEQNHPDADPVLLDRYAREERPIDHQVLAADVEIPTGDRGRFITEHAAAIGRVHWSAILVEEVAEVVEEIGNDERLRAELVQVAAVAVAWIEAIDRRGGGR